MNVIDKRKCAQGLSYGYFIPSGVKPTESELDAMMQARDIIRAAGLIAVVNAHGQIEIKRAAVDRVIAVNMFI